MKTNTSPLGPRVTCVKGEARFRFESPQLAKLKPRAVLGLSGWAVSHIVECLTSVPRYQRGVLLVKPGHSGTGSVALHGIGRTSRLVELRELYAQARVSPSSDCLFDDLLFVPFDGNRYPKTTSLTRMFDWAVSNGLPYAYAHDNDHVWFSAFPSAFEQRVFLAHLTRVACPMIHDPPLLAGRDWLDLRRELREHGLTLNVRECSFARRALQFVLWCGLPRGASLLRADRTPVDINRRITLTAAGWKNPLQLEITSARCPLSGHYGLHQD